MRLFFVVLSILFLTSSFRVAAEAPGCYSSYGGYCAYRGQVEQIYVNASNLILIYFDASLPAGEDSKASYSVTHGEAAVVSIDEQPEFAKLFYSTALAAQVSGRPVSIQMKGILNGYLKADRIWLKQ